MQSSAFISHISEGGKESTLLLFFLVAIVSSQSHGTGEGQVGGHCTEDVGTLKLLKHWHNRYFKILNHLESVFTVIRSMRALSH